MIYLSIDPGKLGGITVMQTSSNNEVRLIKIYAMPSTERDILDLFNNVINDQKSLISLTQEEVLIKCIIEAQHAFPGMASSAQWTFAQHYGFLRGILVSLNIPFVEVSPQRWMAYFGFKRKKDEDKKKHKLRILQKAQNLFPHSTVTLQTADSLMLCEFFRLTNNLITDYQ